MQQAVNNRTHLGLDPADIALVALQQTATTPASPTPVDVAIAQYLADRPEQAPPAPLVERTV